MKQLIVVAAIGISAFTLQAGYTAGETLWETNFPSPRVFQLAQRGNDKLAIRTLPRLSGPVLVEAVVKGSDVTRGPNGWNGLKVMLSYRKADGTADNPQLRAKYGTYDWQTWTAVKAFPEAGAAASLSASSAAFPG